MPKPQTNLRLPSVRRYQATSFRTSIRCVFLALGLLTAIPTIARADPLEESSAPPVGARQPADDSDLRQWLENMVWFHRYSSAEIHAATGVSVGEIHRALERWNIKAETKPINAGGGPLTVLPYPGGRHPRVGFLDGAINPQRETKVSIFTPWDDSSYVVADIPEAIWSNLGLTYLAHTHIPTVWDREQQKLPIQEWQRDADGSLVSERKLPNGIEFGTRVVPRSDSVRMEMWLTNGTDQTLSDLRVQNCVMLKGAVGFDAQTNENKLFRPPYAVCRNEAGDRWIITAWDPIQRSWGNADCPCLHADPQFPDCLPGETKRLTGWLSFYQGTDIDGELARIERTQWRSSERHRRFVGRVSRAADDQEIPCRIHLQSASGDWQFVESVGGSAVRYQRTRADLPNSPEAHTTISAGSFQVDLPAGNYTLRIERGKEFIPLVETIKIDEASSDQQLMKREFRLRQWIDMADRGWYSGDTHVHRPISELPNVVLAEDLNVAFPLSHWITVSDTAPTSTSGSAVNDASLIHVDDTHVIHPLNTEYEIFQVGAQRQTLGAVFVLNQQTPLTIGVPPVGPVATEARRQGALLDLDKHSWPWSLMIAPVMKVDLFELANNHVWQTGFGFQHWTLDSAAEYMNLERDGDGFTEWGWIDYGFQTYYGLINCGLRMRVSAGTASGVHPVQLGFGRVYVHVDGDFDYDQWIAGLDRGRSFVTTGPMLDLRFNGRHAGTTFPVASSTSQSTTLRLTGQCLSRRPLERIEVIVNGQIDRVIEPTNTSRSAGGYVTELDEGIRRSGSFWCAVRCFESHPSGRIRFAHTNPVYVDVPGQPVRPRAAEVEYFVSTVQRQLEQVRGVLSAEALAEYRQALDFYRSRQTQEDDRAGQN